MTTVFVRACAGKSHSWLTPTISRSSPSANRISVADGSSETIRIRWATLAQFWRTLLVQKILVADFVECRQAIRPACNHFFGGHTRLQLPDGLGITDKLNELRGIKLFRIELLQDCSNLKPEPHGAHCEAICDAYCHASTTLAAVPPHNRDETLSDKMQSRQMKLVQGGRDLVSVQPGRPKFLERRLRSAPDGHTRALQDFNPRIHHGSLNRSKIWRRRNPLDPRALEKIIAMPVPH